MRRLSAGEITSRRRSPGSSAAICHWRVLIVSALSAITVTVHHCPGRWGNGDLSLDRAH
ncbi:MAG: hypothetical protein HC838_04550 [Spirulinaceae cyanobacterium RM2_2_10]|nr:hypothetical protein [Spirulinaceae cyanobacterium RM2_2_10]